jgi:putative transposase
MQNRDGAFISHQDSEGKFVKKLSFWHAERVREFAQQEGLAFQSDRERWEARAALRRKWEKLAGLMSDALKSKG